MEDATVSLSLAMYLYNGTDTSYVVQMATTAAENIRTWFLEPSTLMNPNLYYGQIDPRSSTIPKGHGGFIEWSTNAKLLDGLTLFEASLSMMPNQGRDIWTDEVASTLRGFWEPSKASHVLSLVEFRKLTEISVSFHMVCFLGQGSSG